MTISEYISGRLDNAVTGIKANMVAKNINATGRTSNSIRVVTLEKDSHWQIVGGGQNTAPIATLEVGRAAGNIPMGFGQIIYNWGVAKGLANWSMRAAWGVAINIKEWGTKRHWFNEDVYSSIINVTQDDIRKEGKEHVKNIVKEKISNIIHKEIAGVGYIHST